jgi:hypothetical protein
MISIDITTNGAEITIPAGLEKLLDKDNLRVYNQAGAKAATSAAKEYHQKFKDAKNWQGKRYLSGGAGRAGEWADEVTQAWTTEGSDENGAVISNDASFYRHKVTGGTIKPKNGAANLTIPVISDAKGRRAKDYKGDLFFIKTKKGTKGLFEKDGDGVRMVYLLKSEVIQDPWPGALPDTESLARGFAGGWVSALKVVASTL